MIEELWLVKRCEHGWMGEHWLNVDGSPLKQWQPGLVKTPCDGGSVTVLDPELVVFDAERARATTIADIVDALAVGEGS